MGDNPSTSKIWALFTGTAEEPAREPTNRSASTRLAIPPKSLRSVILWTCAREVTPLVYIHTSADDSPATHRCRPARSHATMCEMHKVTPSDRRLVLRVQ